MIVQKSLPARLRGFVEGDPVYIPGILIFVWCPTGYLGDSTMWSPLAYFWLSEL